MALQQRCNLLSLNLAERPAAGVIAGGLSRGQLCRQNRACQAADGGEGGAVCSLSSNSAAGPRPDERFVVFFFCYSFLVLGTVGRRGPPPAHMHSWTARLRLLDLGRLVEPAIPRGGRAWRGFEGGVWGPQTARQAMGWHRPVCFSLVSFVFTSDATAPVIRPGPVCRWRRRWSC